MEIKGKKALVTGAASGIGQATAIRLAREGASLFLTDINQLGLERTCRSIAEEGGTVVLAKAFDISDYGEVRGFASEVHTLSGPLDILVNVAGVALFSQVEDMEHKDWDRVVRINLWGPIHGIECFVPEMVRARRPGHIVSVSSAAGIIGLPWHAVYAGTKHALVGMSESLRYDLRKHGIGVSVICPGAVKTGLVQTVEIHASPPNIAKLRKLFLKHAATPEQVAGMIVDAVRKDRFLVITAGNIKALYFLKRHIPPLYHFTMRGLANIMDRALIPKN